MTTTFGEQPSRLRRHPRFVRSFVRSIEPFPFPGWVGIGRTDRSIDRSRVERFGSVRFGSVRFATTTTSAYVPREGWWFEQSWRTCCRRSFPCVFMSSSFPTTRRTNRTSSRTGTGIGIGIDPAQPRHPHPTTIDPIDRSLNSDSDRYRYRFRNGGTAGNGYGTPRVRHVVRILYVFISMWVCIY